jgi:hypothetical protein
MALLAAAISAEGVRPAPILVTAVNTPLEGWQILPALDAPFQLLSARDADKISSLYTVEESHIWQHAFTAIIGEEGDAAVWYIGGASPDWGGTPFAMALVIENEEVDTALDIGKGILLGVMVP